MAIATDLKKTLSDPSPLYAVAGAGDLAVEKLRALPARFGGLRTELKADPAQLRERMQNTMQTVQARVTTGVGSARENAKTLPEKTQSFAKAKAEKAREVYEELAARGQQLVERGRREAPGAKTAADTGADTGVDTAAAGEHERSAAPTAPTAKRASAQAARARAKGAAARKPGAARTAHTARTADKDDDGGEG